MDTTQQTIDMLRTYIDVQYNSYYLIIIGLIAVTALITGSNLFWNIYVSKNQIASKLNETKVDLAKYFEEKQAELVKELEESTNNKIDNKYEELKLDISRIFGIMSAKDEFFDYSLVHWFNTLNAAIKINNDSQTRVAVDAINRVLDNDKFKEYDKDDFDMETGIELIKSVPNTLRLEKKEILKKLSKLKVGK